MNMVESWSLEFLREACIYSFGDPCVVKRLPSGVIEPFAAEAVEKVGILADFENK
jgi:hypothetical protein